MQISLDALVRKSHEAGVRLAIKKRYGSMICVSRNKIAELAIDTKTTHVLFIDSDMVFDDDALLRLLALKRDIISGLCTMAGEPYSPVVKRLGEDGTYRPIPEVVDGRFRSDVDAVGCAFLLIKTSVFEKLERPYFAMPPYGEGVMGEDVYFCRKAKEAGYDICVDCSLEIGHIGEHVFTINDYRNYKEAYEEQEEEKVNG